MYAQAGLDAEGILRGALAALGVDNISARRGGGPRTSPGPPRSSNMIPPTALDAPADKLDDQEKNFVAQVREHGWFRTSVFEDDEGPGFSYTTGFWRGQEAPEIIVFSLNAQLAHDVLWDLYPRRCGGRAVSDRTEVVERLREHRSRLPACRQALVPRVSGLGSLASSGGDDWPCVQLVWPDAFGKFPWEAGYEERFANSQPNSTGQHWPAL